MEGHFYQQNDNIEIETSPFDTYLPTNSSNYLNSNYTIQISSSPLPTGNNYFQSLLEDPANSRYDDQNGEYGVRYDIYGNSIPRTHLSSPVPRSYNNMSSYEFGRGTFHTFDSPSQEMEIIEPEVSEWELEKENIDPKGALTTPYKSRRTNATTNSMGLSSGRSPLQDITPPVKRKSQLNQSTGIERMLHYNMNTPRRFENLSGQKSVSDVKKMR